jgi:lactate permease
VVWPQNYDPLGNPWLSTLCAALPVIVLLAAIALFRVRIHLAALLGLGLALAIAMGIFHMPATAALASAVYGAGFGFFPIGWIILNVIFFYQITVDRGLFATLRESLARVTPDPRVQLVLIAFAFGAFLEGLAGFGAPVAITGAILIQLGFRPLTASCLALLANTAPVAFGSVGIPIVTLEQVTGLDARTISMMVGRQLPFFSVLIPFWLIAAYGGWRALRGAWPAALVAGLAFAIPQALVANLHGPWLVDCVAGACSITALIVLLRFWQPRDGWQPGEAIDAPRVTTTAPSRARTFRAWLPWVMLSGCILLWGLPDFGVWLNKLFAPQYPMPGLHGLVQRVPPVALAGAKPESVLFRFNLLSATGTAILFAAIAVALALRFSPREFFTLYARTIWRVRWSLLTIMAMLALGNVTKYSGTDATLGLALAHTGWFYPFFGTLLGWLGVALTGSDTASNVLFGSLQKITANQLGLSPILMGAANSSGGVMGKMIDAQSIVVASTATQCYGQEGAILRRVFWHSLALVTLVGLLVMLQAYAWPFTLLVPKS